MTMHAKGSFEVKLAPQATDAEGVGRFSLDKQYRGDLEAAAKGEMLSVGSETKGSGAYVAVERVEGTLHGRRGAFALHHSGVMTRGQASLSIAVAPDSATGELAGLEGRLDIQIADGRHTYDFAYTLPAAR